MESKNNLSRPIKTRLSKLFDIEYPIIQGGMIWAAGWKLASAVSQAGGLGLIGGGSMQPDLFREHIRKAKAAANKPFGVNIPLMYEHSPGLLKAAIEENIDIVFTSAGNPAKIADTVKSAGIKWVHCVPTVKMARKAQDAGVDAVVAEGVEAGGHNGFDGVTTFCLVPQAADAVDIPVIAAGGICDWRGFKAAMILGAEAVQIGTRFAAAIESSAAEEYKRAVVDSNDTGTYLAFRTIGPIRIVRTAFAQRIQRAEYQGASAEELHQLHGKGRGRLGIFMGNGDEGLFEAGQSAGMVSEIISAGEVVRDLVRGYWEHQDCL
ncbi:MAG: nitronate monooxygenase [candidate division Zixibacteria bacterium]|nr:nitronate monooxygenase [Candidatus Tariuqbacter arcticus]